MRLNPVVARRTSLHSRLDRAGTCDLGNMEAAERGPEAYGQRVARRKVYRSTNRSTARFLRRLGL